jgi:hypothetical protein
MLKVLPSATASTRASSCADPAAQAPSTASNSDIGNTLANVINRMVPPGGPVDGIDSKSGRDHASERISTPFTRVVGRRLDLGSADPPGHGVIARRGSARRIFRRP